MYGLNGEVLIYFTHEHQQASCTTIRVRRIHMVQLFFDQANTLKMGGKMCLQKPGHFWVLFSDKVTN